MIISSGILFASSKPHKQEQGRNPDQSDPKDSASKPATSKSNTSATKLTPGPSGWSPRAQQKVTEDIKNEKFSLPPLSSQDKLGTKK